MESSQAEPDDDEDCNRFYIVDSGWVRLRFGFCIGSWKGKNKRSCMKLSS